MKLVVDIPDYDGNAMDVIWESGSKYDIKIEDGNSVVISANKRGLISLAKQMLYMAENDLPQGSHVHYDSFFAPNNDNDLDLIIEKLH